MQVTSTTSADRTAAAATSDSGSTTATTSRKTTLGQEDFMKLLAVQFQQQDPMKPMEDTAFIAQMAQFTSLDQTKAMLTQMSQLSTTQQLASANSYLGRQVTLDVGDGESLTGIVSAVRVDAGTPQLIVNGNGYAVSSVTLVQPAPAPTTSNNSTNP